MDISKKEKQFLLCAERSCGFSYRASCNRNIVDTGKILRSKGLVYLQDRGEKRQYGRYVWRITDNGLALLEKNRVGG